MSFYDKLIEKLKKFLFIQKFRFQAKQDEIFGKPSRNQLNLHLIWRKHTSGNVQLFQNQQICK